MSATRWRTTSASSASSGCRNSSRPGDRKARWPSVVERLRKLHRENAAIGVERAFLPADAEEAAPQASCPRRGSSMPPSRWSGSARGRRREELDCLRTRLRARGRFDARDHRQPRSGHHQARDGRGAPPRGSVARPHLRVLPDHRRHQPQPRAVRPGLARGRSDVDRLRRQLQGLYRRPLPDGDARRAGRRASGPPRRDRGDPAWRRGSRSGPARAAATSSPRPARCFALRPTATSSISSPTAWA